MYFKLLYTLGWTMVFFVSAPNFCWGDNGFIPGDAFFHTLLEKNYCDSLTTEERSLKFVYYRPQHLGGTLSGYGGLWEIEITDTTPQFTRGLKTLYSEIRRTYPRQTEQYTEKEIVETNGIHFFIYNKNYDIKSRNVGLKYNEDWADFPDSAYEGNTRPFRWPSERYESFIQGDRAVIADWRRASDVDALQADIPQGVPWGMAESRPHNGTLKISLNDIRIIAIPDGQLNAVYKKKNHSEFWELGSDGLPKHFEWLHAKRQEVKS